MALGGVSLADARPDPLGVLGGEVGLTNRVTMYQCERTWDSRERLFFVLLDILNIQAAVKLRTRVSEVDPSRVLDLRTHGAIKS
jgi:hypothetical protein